MSFSTCVSWLCTGAMLALLVCSILVAFRRQYAPWLRFGPLVVAGAYLAAGLIHFLVEGVASMLIIPIGCVGLVLGVRMFLHRSALSCIFAVCSFIFWPAILFVCSRYLVLTHLHR